MNALPQTKRKVGTELYSCVSYTEDGKAKTEIWTWVITDIRRPKRTAIQMKLCSELPVMCTAVVRNDLTFKNGDWNQHIIRLYADIYKKEWPVEKEMGFGLATTIMKAVSDDIALTEGYIAELVSENADAHEIDEQKSVLAALQRRLKKLRKK